MAWQFKSVNNIKNEKKPPRHSRGLEENLLVHEPEVLDQFGDGAPEDATLQRPLCENKSKIIWKKKMEKNIRKKKL